MIKLINESLNFQDIPPHLWNTFPSNGNYLKNIIQFNGYFCRESILKLKDQNEVSEMFRFVIDRQELVDDKKSMFGIFAKNPSLLTVLPGLEPVLKRFIANVLRNSVISPK